HPGAGLRVRRPPQRLRGHPGNMRGKGMETYSLQPFGLEATSGQEQWVEKEPFAFRLYSVSPQEVEAVAARLKAQAAAAQRRPLAQNIEALHQLGLLWSDPTYPLRQEAWKVLPSLTHLSPAMVQQEMGELCRLLRREILWEWVERELGSRQTMDSWVERDSFLIQRRPRGLIFHNLSGNAFLLPALAILFGLLTKNATLLKLATAEPYFGVRFAESLREVDPQVSAQVAVLYWSAREEACYHALFRQGLGAAVAWGDLRTVRMISHYAGQYRTRFIDHGARIGIALIDRIRHQEVAQAAQDLAMDIVPWEGYSCISPPFIFVVEGEVGALEFAEALLSSMDALRVRYERKMTLSQHSALIANQEYYFFHLEAEKRGKVLTSQTTGSTVIYSESPPTLKDLEVCGGGMVMVCRMSRPEEVASALLHNGLAEYCQALAFHGSAIESIDPLAALGISHITRPGRLNAKEIGFSHDGVLNLQELTRLVTRSRK
ncbi:MAG: acyl-CoA reductase, partial [candidate division NC10 bacterium]|nr:acyl-CoA reductase [candidate division NC10 bacterium]